MKQMLVVIVLAVLLVMCLSACGSNNCAARGTCGVEAGHVITNALDKVIVVDSDPYQWVGNCPQQVHGCP